MAYLEIPDINRELEIRQPWPPPLHAWVILKGHLFRPLALIKCNLEGFTIQSWLGISARLLYSADGQVPHLMLQSKGAEIHQLITQPGKNLPLFIQPKPPCLSILTQVYTVVEERKVHPHEDVMPLNSKITLAALELYLRQLIADSLLRTLCQEEQYSSCNMLLSEAKLQDDTGCILIDHPNRLAFGIVGVLVTWSGGTCEARTVQSYMKFARYNPCQEETNFKVEQLLYPNASMVASTTPDAFHGSVCNGIRMERSRGSGELLQCLVGYVLGECFSNNTFGFNVSSTSTHYQISKANLPAATTVFFWVPVVLVDNTNPYPEGCTLALCSCEKCWTISEPTALHSSDQLWWLSVLHAYASRIWLITWAENDLELSSGYRQAPSQKGRNVTNQSVVSDSVHVGHNYYIAFVNKIAIGYNYCSNQDYSFDTIYSDLIYYHEDYHCNAGNIKEVHTPWDPGKSAIGSPPKMSAWGQAEFQEGRNVMTLACVPQVGPLSQVINDGLSPDGPTRAIAATNRHQEVGLVLDYSTSGFQ